MYSQNLTCHKHICNFLWLKTVKSCSLSTLKGLFRYTRLPYEVSVAPAMFPSVMDNILQGLPVVCYLDDILIVSPTMEEHDSLLDKVLHILVEWIRH